MDKTFQFYIKTRGAIYYVVNNGIVDTIALTSNNSVPPLGEVVASWRDVEVRIDRALENWGALIQYSLDSISFINDGAIILKHIAYNLGVESDIILEVRKLNTLTLRYDLWTECNIEMASFDADSISVNVSLFEGGLVGLLNNRSDVEYSIPINTGAIRAKIDGALVKSSAFWSVGNSNRNIDYTDTIEYVSVSSVLAKNINCNIPITFSSANVIRGQFIIPSSQDLLNGGVWGNQLVPLVNRNANRNGIATTTNDWKSVTIKGRFNFTYSARVGSGSDSITGGTAQLWAVCALKSDFARQEAFTISGFVNLDTSGSWNTYTIDYERGLPNISSDYIVYIVLQLKANSLASSVIHSVQIWNDVSTLDLSFNSKVPSTNAIGYRYIDFIRKFVSKLTDNRYRATSNFLANLMSQQDRNNNYGCSPLNIFITSGTGLRSLPNPSITTSWNAILQDLFAQFNIIPSYIGDEVILEPMKDIFSSQVIFRTNSVNNIRVSCLHEKMFNTVNVGQVSQSNDNIVGLNEFNTTVNFLVQENTNVKSELNLISPFRRDVYGIESARAESFEEPKANTKFDKDVWQIEISDNFNNGAYLPYRVNTSYIQGVDDPLGIYNTTLSPKRALLRNISYIKSFYNKGILTFVSTDKNPSLVSNTRLPYSAIANISETSNESLDTDVFYGITQESLFTPFVIEFDCGSDYNLVELVSNNLNGLVEFVSNGVVYKGWILDIGCKPSTRDEYRFRLISHKGNNLTELT